MADPHGALEHALRMAEDVAAAETHVAHAVLDLGAVVGSSIIAGRLGTAASLFPGGPGTYGEGVSHGLREAAHASAATAASALAHAQAEAQAAWHHLTGGGTHHDDPH